jgi:hypothetical protein
MPDFNRFASDLPVQRPELTAGLSQIVYPKYDYINTFPPTADLNDNPQAAQQQTKGFWEDDAKDLNKMFAGVPTAPGGVTPYNEAKRFNSDNLKFLPGRDNEDLYAQDQSILGSIGHGAGRLVGLSVSKTGTGFGYLAGLVGVGNDSEKYGHGFSSWIAGASDNGMAKWFNNLENETIKNDWLPIYKKASEKDHGFFRHMGDLDFWTDDLVDGAAFMVSSFAPGMGLGKLKLGANTIRGLQGLQKLGYAEEAAALSEEGVSGTVASKALEQQGIGATLETPETGGNIIKTNGGVPTGADATQQIPRAIKWIDNARLARSIDVGSVSVINTAAQAMYSANDAKNSAYETLINKKDAQGNNVYTVDQAKTVAAKVAKDSYLMNLGALSLMNLWEANFLFKKPQISNKLAGGVFETNGLFGDAALAKKTFGRRVLDATLEPGKGVLTAGVWLGNMQLAIDRLNNNPDNFDLDFGSKLKGVGKQYLKQTADLAVGNDPEAAKALGIGSFLGAAAGKFLGPEKVKETATSLSNLNNNISAFKELGNIYKTDENGNLNLENGTPVLDEDKIKSFVASMNKVLSLNQTAKAFENKGVHELAKIYNDEVFARFAKAHFDSGLGDLLHQKLNDVSNISKEDLALLGYDPDSKNKATADLLDSYRKKANSLEEIYNNIQNNYVPADLDLNKKADAKKYFDITDKMFYLSAREHSLSQIISDSKAAYDKVKANTDIVDKTYNSETDNVVDRYNELYEQLHSAKNQPYNYNAEGDYSKIDLSINAAKDELENFTKDNKEVLERLKKDARGRYMYELTNKNSLPSAREMERQQIIQAEAGLSRNATVSVLSRLADPKFGVKYFDDVYSKELERHADASGLYNDLTSDIDPQEKEINDHYKDPSKDITKLKSEVTPEEINDAYAETIDGSKITNKGKIVDHIAEKVSKGQPLTDQEEAIRRSVSDDVEDKLQKQARETSFSDLSDERDELERRRDELEGNDDRSTEEETELENIHNQLEALGKTRDEKYNHLEIERTVDNSVNIREEDRGKYTEILNKINAEKNKVTKFPDHYEINGQNYRKVTDLIGDVISYDQRNDPATQASVAAGNTIDNLAKDFFANKLNRDTYGDKMTEDAYNKAVKTLEGIKKNLQDKGIEIVANNVFVVDHNLKVAGEIDLLGVDKNGAFKVYEVQARRGDIYRQYGKKGLGIKIRDIDSKRLSMYRNMFANQYGAIPDEIAVKFPFEVKYDKTNPSGFIEGAKLKEEIRFKPLKNVEIKMKNSEPIRIGSKYNSVDMNRIFLDTFLPTKESGDKLKYLFRNVPTKELLKGMKIKVRQALPEFQAKYELQTKALAKEPVDFKIKKFRDYRNKDASGEPREFPNLYSLVGNTEISLDYDGTPSGYFSPVQTLAYKDIDGSFKILDETTDKDTYTQVTGNDANTYDEFRKVAAAYKKLHTELTSRMLESPNKEITLTNEELNKLVDLKPSVGELDLVKSKDARPLLKDLTYSGVRQGGKSIPTIVNVDGNDSIKVLMDKSRKNSALVKKYQEIDRWANNNLDHIKAAMFDRNGTKVTDNVAIVETPNGEYKVVSLKAKESFKPEDHDDFVDNLGSQFTAATTKNVFKNENIMVVPKITDESTSINLADHEIVSKVYDGQDVDVLEKYGFKPGDVKPDTTDAKVEDFLRTANESEKQDLEDFGLTTKQAILDDFHQGEWSNIDDYINNLRNCK